MKKIFQFEAEIKKHYSLNAAYIEFPFDVFEEFGRRGQIKVLVRFDDFEYRSSLVKMDHTCHWIGLTQEVRKKTGKEPGDIIQVELSEDTEPRVVEVPEDLAVLLDQNAKALERFDKLSYTHKKEYIRWITSAKKTETKIARLEKTIDLLVQGIKTPDNQKKNNGNQAQ